MYPNLEAELARKNVRRVDLAELLNCSLSTIVAKLRGTSELTFGEVIKIKKHLGVTMPLEILFASEPDTPAV